MTIKKTFFGLILLLCVGGPALGQSLTVDERVVDFGEKYQYAVLSRDIHVWNNSKRVLLLAPRTSKIAAITFDSLELLPGKSTVLHISFPLEDRSGEVSFRVGFDATSNDGKAEYYELQLKCFVDSLLDDPKPILNFGVIDTGRAVPERTFVLASAADTALRITGVIETPTELDVRVVDAGRALAIRPNNFSLLGYRKSQVKVSLNSKLQSQASLVVFMDVHGNVIPDQDPVDFGVQRENKTSKVRVQLTSRDHRAFKVGKVTIESARIDVQEVDCLPQKLVDCRAFTLSIGAEQPLGQLTGWLKIVLPDSHQELLLKLNGLLLGKDTVVESLNERQNLLNNRSEVKPPIDIAQSLRAVADPVPEIPPAGTGPLLKWKVANEAGIYGYAIFRSDSPSGNFVRINHDILKAQNKGDNTEAAYAYRDVSTDVGKQYWYYIEIFYNTGKKVQLTEPQKVLAK